MAREIVTLRVSAETVDVYVEAAELLGVAYTGLMRGTLEGSVPAMRGLVASLKALGAGGVGMERMRRAAREELGGEGVAGSG